MKHSHVMVLLAATMAVTACADDPAEPTPAAVRFSQSVNDGSDTYLVRFKGNGIPSGFSAQVAKLGGEVIFAHAGAGVAAVSGLIPSAADALAGAAGIAAVDADAYTELEQPYDFDVEIAQSDIESPAAPQTAVRYARQWHLHAIEAGQAWAAGMRGSSAVRVGILDTGLDYLHPDLVGRVDLALSRSFLSAAENARVQTAWPGAHPVADLHYHGTHVGATVASNAYIAAGVASEIMLVGLKVCAPGTAPAFNGTCPTSGTLAAILYAADNGIPIINMSLGSSFHRRLASARGGNGPSFLATINSVMNYANRMGTVVVVSAGNSAIDMNADGGAFKTYCDAVHVICVSSTAPSTGTLSATTGAYFNLQNIDGLAVYSNFGGKVTVAAPGGNALGAPNSVPVWEACSGFTIVTGLLACRNRFFNSPTSWSGFIVGISGTSMAAPHTAGVAALIKSHIGGNAAQLRDRVAATADDLGPAGYDAQYGNGRINARRALGL